MLVRLRVEVCPHLEVFIGPPNPIQPRPQEGIGTIFQDVLGTNREEERQGENIVIAERLITIGYSHLRYDIMEAAMGHNENRHPLVVMKELGITYQHATPQSMGEQWWFWNCENQPKKLPSYLTPLDLNPIECIGYGLSKEEAELIGNMVTVTSTNFPECKHANGWYHTVWFWIFECRFFACNDCGKLVKLSKWTV